jgi:hypothetical protein
MSGELMQALLLIVVLFVLLPVLTVSVIGGSAVPLLTVAGYVHDTVVVDDVYEHVHPVPAALTYVSVEGI